MRLDDFTGAVSAELPAFVGPEDGDHGQAKIGPEGVAALRRTHGRGQIAEVPAHGKQYGAEENDDANFGERGPILQIRALARPPDVHDGDHRDHGDGGECRG